MQSDCTSQLSSTKSAESPQRTKVHDRRILCMVMNPRKECGGIQR